MSEKTIREISGLDILFEHARMYRKSSQAKALYEFVANFPKLAPLNALLVHIQQPHSRMVATAWDWRDKYGRQLKFNAKPLIILWPFGPVNFVFDIGDTEPGPDAKEIPEVAVNPFQPSGELCGEVWSNIHHNLLAVGIMEVFSDMGSLQGGSIQPMRDKHKYYALHSGMKLKIMYAIKLRKNVDLLTTFATLIHELGHLFCGHLTKWKEDKRFPNRQQLDQKEKRERDVIQEFEAESVSWLVCRRLGIDIPAGSYLGGYWKDENKDLPEISLEAIFSAAGKIEALCKGPCKPHKSVVIDENSPEALEYRAWERY